MRVRDAVSALYDALSRRAATVRRGRIGAWIDAAIAVRAGVSLQHHLESRYADYAARRPTVSGEPWSIVIHEGTVFRSEGRLDPREAVLADPAGVDASMEDNGEATRVRATRAALDAQRGYFARELATRQERLDQVEAVRQRLDDEEISLRGVLDSELHAERALPVRTARRSEVTRGRPVLRGAFARVITQALLCALLIGESLQVYPIMADAMGISGDLSRALLRAPFTALLALIASVTAMAALFCALEAGVSLVSHAITPGRPLARLVQLFGGLVTLGVFAGGAAAIAVLRERSIASLAAQAAMDAGHAASDAEIPVWVTFALTVVLSAGAAGLRAVVREIDARREATRESQRQWDIAQSDRIESRERAEERLEQVLKLRAENERATEQARAAVVALETEARSAEAALAESIASDRARLMTWLFSTEAALLLDRTMFWLAATRRGREELLGGERTTEDSGVRKFFQTAPIIVSNEAR
jgi:hypothetical protein